jgi:hypothetical protein
VEGSPDPGDGSNIAIIRFVTPDYLSTLGVPLSVGAHSRIAMPLARRPSPSSATA